MEIFQSLAKKLSRALPFLHAFTGCDTTSSFYRHGKCSFWDSWMKSEEISELTNTFFELSDMTEMITPFHVDNIQRYFIKVYFPQESILSLTDLRLKYYFRSPDPQLKSLIIPRDGLTNHIKRSGLQAGWIWKLDDHEVTAPEPTDWGWAKIIDMFIPRWCNEYKSIDDVIVVCSCKDTGNCLRCKYGKSAVEYITYCNCSRKCTYVTSCSRKCTYVTSCSRKCTYVTSCSRKCTYVTSCSRKCTYVTSCSRKCTYVTSCSRKCTYVTSCSRKCTYVTSCCSRKCTYVTSCSRKCTYVTSCSRKCTYVTSCSRKCTYVTSCSRKCTYVTSCSRKCTYVTSCSRKCTYVTSCSRKCTYVTSCSRKCTVLIRN